VHLRQVEIAASCSRCERAARVCSVENTVKFRKDESRFLDKGNSRFDRNDTIES